MKRTVLAVVLLGAFAALLLWLHPGALARAVRDSSPEVAERAQDVSLRREAVRTPALQGSAASAEAWPAPTTENPSAAEEESHKAAQRRIYASLRDRPKRTQFHEQVMATFVESSLHPPSNHMFKLAEADPIAQRYETEHRTKRSDDGRLLATAWLDQTYYAVGDTAHVFLTLQDAQTNAAVPPNAPEVAFLNGESEKHVADLAFSDSDGDLTFEAKLDTTGFPPGRYEGLVLAADGLAETVGFMLSEPTADFTGKYRDRLEGGDLIIEAEVKVASPGSYQLRATLYRDKDHSIGLSEVNHELQAGTQWVQLRFHGLMFHRADADGPYLLKHITLVKRVMPPRWGGDVQPNYWTTAYDQDQFTSEPYNRLE